MQVQVYPNPFSDFVNIEISGAKGQTFDYQLFNPIGQKVAHGRLDAYPFQLKKNDLTAGVYYLAIQSDLGETASLKLMVL